MAQAVGDQPLTPPLSHQSYVDQQLNPRLRQDLGMRGGIPRYKWIYSDIPMHPVRQTYGSDDDSPGTLVYDYRCACGLNRAKHLGECSGAVIPEPRFFLRRLIKGWKNRDGTQIHRQWVLWAFVEPPSEADWYAAFGDQLDYTFYAQGSYEPFTIGTAVAAVRHRDFPPTVDLNAQMISIISNYHKATESEIRDRLIAARDYDRKVRRDHIKDQIKDHFPMGNIPGRKDCGVSFRHVTPQPKRGRGEMTVSQAIDS